MPETLIDVQSTLGAMSGTVEELGAPEHLGSGHDVSAFDCGNPDLNDWLKKRALSNEESGASRTYVACSAGRVVGYYALASGGVTLAVAAKTHRLPQT